MGFNEAGILHPEKLSAKMRTRDPPPCFNEAGILHPEKRPAMPAINANAATLQ